MECSKVEKLLSLYVASDLEDDLLSAVSLHLRSCHPCSRLADEYRESQGWLRSYAPPDFDRTFYDGVRSAVLEEINRSAAAPVFPWQFPFQSLRRRLTLAAPVVLLLAASVLAIYTALDRVNLDATHNRLTAVGTRGPEKPVEIEDKSAPRSGNKSTRTPLLAASPSRRTPRISAARKMPKCAALSTEAGTEIVRALPSPAAQPSVASTEQRVSEETIASTAGTTTDQETTRIEIQTSDPNIRIIWFALKGTE